MILFIHMEIIKIKTNNNKIKRIKKRAMLIKINNNQRIIINNLQNHKKTKEKVIMIKVRIKFQINLKKFNKNKIYLPKQPSKKEFNKNYKWQILIKY